jgi:hypothetical protein
VKHRALQQFAGVEARPVVLNVAPDPVDRGQDVRQALTVVSQGDGLCQDPTASPRATEPNTRTSRKPRRDAAARICLRIARRDPRSGDRSCRGGPGTMSPFPGTACYSCPSPLHGTRGRDLRVASCQASQLAATRIAQSRMLLASQASNPSSPSRRTPWHARPTRQLLYVTGQL